MTTRRAELRTDGDHADSRLSGFGKLITITALLVVAQTLAIADKVSAFFSSIGTDTDEGDAASLYWPADPALKHVRYGR